MSLQQHDLKDLVDHIIEIDSYKSKMGDDKDIVTIAMSTKTYESAKKYFHYIGKQNGVKKVELTVQEALRQ